MESLHEFAKKQLKHTDSRRNWSFAKSVNLSFDKKEYLKYNKGFDRKSMPQIDFEAFMQVKEQIATLTTLSSGTMYPSMMKASQNDVNVSKVFSKIANNAKVDKDYVFILAKDNYLLDGHHTHVQACIQNPEREVYYIKFEDIEIEELIEMFTTTLSKLTNASRDIQDNIVKECFENYSTSPAVGMGAVEFPEVATSTADAMNPENRGSGDIPGTTKKKRSTKQ